MTRVGRIGVLAAAITAIAIAGVAPAEADRSHVGLATIMTGGQEIPGPGDADGVGFAGLLVSPSRGRICYFLAVKDIAPATAAHIHRGAVGVAGPVVVGLDAPTRGWSANCAAVDPVLAQEIADTPEQFYVNVHNAEFPGGAVRGQLDD